MSLEIWFFPQTKVKMIVSNVIKDPTTNQKVGRVLEIPT